MRTFIGRCRKYNLSRETLEVRSRMHEACSDVEKKFLAVGIAILDSYLGRLAQDYLEDFDGLVWHAIAAVNENRVRFIRDAGREQGNLTSLRFILIDEYQDFSEMFYAFVSAIRAVNQDVRFFCVGDDWQAINAFAGSDLRYFKDFHKYFDTPQQLMIATNYRSPVSIVRLGVTIQAVVGLKHRSYEIQR